MKEQETSLEEYITWLKETYGLTEDEAKMAAEMNI